VQTLAQKDQREYVERAHALVPLLVASGDAIERAGRLTEPVLEAFYEAGLFKLLLPRAIGGAEIDPAIFAEVVEAIAMGDGSAAWCVAQGGGCAMAGAFLEPEVAWQVYGDRRAVVAWGPPSPSARAEVVDGGYRLSGRWQFGSGSAHATWLGGQSVVTERDGSKRMHGGRAQIRQMLFPAERATFHDVWNVVGLRGTASNDYSVSEIVVPHEFTFDRDVPAERREHGALYSFGALLMYAVAFGSVALGLARSSLNAVIELAGGKTSRQTDRPVGESAGVQMQLGLAETRLRGARTFLLESLREAYAAGCVSEEIPVDLRFSVRMAATGAMLAGREVVDIAYHTAGATAIFTDQPFERRFRDMHAVSQQVQGHPMHFENVGKYLLGLDYNKRYI
jgi:alkylation response protein AidB-like acyl-CoA dehydrogenase